MKPRVMAELLTQYVDRIIAGRDDTNAYLELFSSHRRELAPVFSVVKLLRAMLVKGEPSPVFLESLGLGLRVAAQRAILERPDEPALWHQPPSRRMVMISAAALGSVAWLTAFLLLNRSRVASVGAKHSPV